jgi:salicylate hydroxylase
LTTSRPLIIAGAGIGGLSAALALAQRGLRVAVFEQADGLAAAGAGIQLSPNASRILIGLGLAPQLQPCVVAPTELRVRNARDGRVVAQVPLVTAEARYGAPYWLIHRGDLHTVLMNAACAHPLVTLVLGTRIEEFVVHEEGVCVSTLSAARAAEERGLGLIGADGLWSQLRRRLGRRREPRFAGHTAWRALVPADAIPPELRTAAVSLWLGRDAHLVHYPVRGGSLVNVVAIVHDDWREPGWTTLGAHSDLLARFGAEAWQEPMRALVAGTQSWSKWALYDAAPFAPWGKDCITLLGDAAHPMLPYLAQGAAAAIEDAAVLARALSQMPADPARAMRLYERERGRRTARMQRAARANGRLYHLGSLGALMRTFALRALGGARMLARYDWLYGWKPA